MAVHLSNLLKAIQAEANAISSQMHCLQCQGSAINVVTMLQLQLTMNKFSQISDLGSTSISLFNQSFKTMITNVLR
jgi:cytochrome c-type biogenesis protein CcmH/NrfF